MSSVHSITVYQNGMQHSVIDRTESGGIYTTEKPVLDFHGTTYGLVRRLAAIQWKSNTILKKHRLFSDPFANNEPISIMSIKP